MVHNTSDKYKTDKYKFWWLAMRESTLLSCFVPEPKLNVFTKHSPNPSLELGENYIELNLLHHLPVDPRPVHLHGGGGVDGHPHPHACILLTLLPYSWQQRKYKKGNEM